MTAPTREQIEDWAREAGLLHVTVDGWVWAGAMERFAALAFAAGQSGQAAGSGAELVREIEAAAVANVRFLKLGVLPPDMERSRECARLKVSPYWPRLRAALISGDAAREEAERWRELVPLMVKHPDSSCWFIGPPLGAGDDFVVAFDRARGGKSNA